MIVSYFENAYYILSGRGGRFPPVSISTESMKEAITHIVNHFYEKLNIMMIVTKACEFKYSFSDGYFDNSRELLVCSDYGNGKDFVTMEKDEIRLLYKNNADIENRLKEEMEAVKYIKDNRDTVIECSETIIYSEDLRFVFMDKKSGEKIKEPIL
jgi:hypothetical protein